MHNQFVIENTFFLLYTLDVVIFCSYCHKKRGSMSNINKKHLQWIFLGAAFIAATSFTVIKLYAHQRKLGPLRILHMGFHTGCIKDFDEVAHELGLEVTNWYILGDRPRFDGYSLGNAVYNIGHRRAELVWNRHKDYFDQFDVIVTSDTAPLSRIFLQNGWKKPLVIWICNRFDYCDYASLDCPFPDQEYYDLFQKAMMMPNVKIISYTPVEYLWAASKGIHIGSDTIKPVGSHETTYRNGNESAIPASVDKSNTLFIPGIYMNDKQKNYLLEQCKNHNISAYSGRYNGPYDLKDFKGILYMPKQWSNLALFENIYNGIVHFVPSQKFIRDAVGRSLPILYCTLDSTYFVESEWYRKENTSLFVYFDSWEDLAEKVRTTDYKKRSEIIKQFAAQHRQTMLARWKVVFDDIKKSVGIS